MMSSPLTVGLPAEQMSPSRLGAQTAVAVLPSSWVQVGPWQAMSQAMLNWGYLCNWLYLAAQSQDQRW